MRCVGTKVKLLPSMFSFMPLMKVDWAPSASAFPSSSAAWDSQTDMVRRMRMRTPWQSGHGACGAVVPASGVCEGGSPLGSYLPLPTSAPWSSTKYASVLVRCEQVYACMMAKLPETGSDIFTKLEKNNERYSLQLRDASLHAAQTIGSRAAVALHWWTSHDFACALP